MPMMRRVLEGIGAHSMFAKGLPTEALDVTGVPAMDIGIVNHLNKTLQAARLKGAQVIVTGISDAVAESPTPLAESPTPLAESPTPLAESPTPLAEGLLTEAGDWGAHSVDWGPVETLRDLQTGLRVALSKSGVQL